MPPNGEDTDEEAIRATLEGRVDAFETLVRRYERLVYRIARGFCRDPDEAEDFAQDVFVKAFSKLATFRHGARFSTWLARIAWNSGINMVRRGKRYEPLADPDSFPGSDDVPEGVDRERAAELLRKAIADLPPKWALCVDLCYFEGLSYAEMSKVTGMPVNTVKSHVFRAKRALREALEGKGGGNGS